MNNINNQMWRKIADRYLNAQTSPDEEDALMRFIASDNAAGPEFNDIRAVMSLTVIGRRQHKAARRRRRIIATLSTAAAITAILLCLPAITKTNSEYTVYTGGTVRTDKAFALAKMRDAMADIHRPDDIVNSQLTDMFNTTDEN